MLIRQPSVSSEHKAELKKEMLFFSDVDEIEIIGVCTDICVISNAMIIKAKMPEKEIFVNETCCAGVTPESHKNALEAMKMCHINVHSNNNELD